MRIGFANIYSWRPHVEHMFFLATLVRKAGHETFFLTCDGDLGDCYTREMRNRPAWRECLECRLGGIRSYASQNVTAIGDYARQPDEAVREGADVTQWVKSSASTLGRFESNDDYASESFRDIALRLAPPTQQTYDAARAWIQANRLEAVFLFNARMDVTRAIFEAARSLGVRIISVERTWFGDGLQLLPDENCLGLRAVNDLVGQWKDSPLTLEQAARAAAHVAARFTRTNVKEWRAYNTGAESVAWPASGRHKILLIPSSRNEVWGHPDWEPHWSDPTDAYDALIARFALQPSDLVLRCHPNWGEKIGAQDGSRSERHYANWAAARSILCIPSTDKASTLGLIGQCDAIVVANGSAAMEAGFLGKQVIGIAPSIYQAAGIRDEAGTPAEVAALSLWKLLPEVEHAERRDRIRRQTVRFLYSMIYRVAQYTAAVKAEATTRFRYDFAADPQRLVTLLRTGTLTADDATCAEDPRGEEEILARIRDRDWQALIAAPAAHALGFASLPRRLLYRPIDLVSKYKSVGDR